LSSLRFELKGLEKLNAKLKKISKMEEIESIVEKNGVDMQLTGIGICVFIVFRLLLKR